MTVDDHARDNRKMDFEVVSEITDVRTIAVGASIRELPRLRKVYGRARWRKRKGIATVRLANESLCQAELHWYESPGLGRKEMKIKQLLGERS